jgi:ribonuclease VapC
LIVDSSAVVALLRGEPKQLEISARLLDADLVAIGAPTLFETSMVMVSAAGDAGRGVLLQFLQDFDVEVAPFGRIHWQIAMEAFDRYGKGRHPAGLNLGDCMAYATARVAGEPLLYVGDDFARTDLEAA